MISVVLPVFNVEEYIEDCINSLLQQTSDNIEVVLVDDGGKDRSIELAKSLLERGHLPYKIVCKRNKDGSVENQGLSAAESTKSRIDKRMGFVPGFG